MANPQAAQQVMTRLRAILDLFDDDDIEAGIALLDPGSRESFRAMLRRPLPRGIQIGDGNTQVNQFGPG